MEIRPATFEDRSALGDLMAASMTALSEGFYSPSEAEKAARYLTVPDDDLIEDGTLYVVEIDGQLAGTGGWSSRKKLFTGSDDQELLRTQRLDPANDPARIRAFFVASEFARRGIARRLYEECAQAASHAGFRSLALMATLPGVPLYRALGFGNERPVNVTLPDGSELPCIEMSRRIS